MRVDTHHVVVTRLAGELVHAIAVVEVVAPDNPGRFELRQHPIDGSEADEAEARFEDDRNTHAEGGLHDGRAECVGQDVAYEDHLRRRPADSRIQPSVSEIDEQIGDLVTRIRQE